MARIFRIAILMVSILSARSTFAAGGSCNSIPVPSGITDCFYISAAGADTNNGTSEATPWLHSPGMQNCANNCNITPAPGQGFIFRGGDTWHFGNSSASPYAGVVANCQLNGTASGGLCLSSINKGASSGPPIYYGVDQSWFSGGSWSRPVFTADNPLTPHPGTFQDFVASCTYQVGANNDLTTFADSSHIIFDNFELTGLCSKTLNGGGGDVYLEDAGATNNIYEHVYIHGWTHIQFSCSGGTGYCFNIRAIHGNTTGQGQFLQFVVDGSDSDPGGSGAIFNGGYIVAQSVFRFTTQAIPNGVHIWHDNLLEHWYEPGDLVAHGNLWEENGEAAGTNAVYNNIFRNVCDGSNCPGGLVGIWPEVPVGSTEYWFNNLIYDQNSGGNYFNVGQNANSGNQGSLVIFNNVFEQPVSGLPVLSCSASGFAFPFIAANNHYIVDGGLPFGSTCSGQGTFLTELAMTHATAAANGYTVSKNYAYSPTSSSAATTGVGTNEQGFCTKLLAAGLSDAAAACRSDTSYACIYNSSDHTVSCPARTVNARPASLAWDRGAYQSGGTQASAPNPPTGLMVSVR